MRTLGDFVGRERRCKAWATLRPASSISWSIVKAPDDINSSSRAAAALEARVRRGMMEGK
ncbi:hypothetical protein AC579_2703 [Pseudocercospora musae]|uniref:Uncharacterized protein n=1 Tax=Pseudocercospora musae TaxID=113226 RepID=A0A139IVC7_9PEZI|nr:hypothetical protein AC579_2703 [Pseudocercospora musae]KXT18711.1 hypothetical protein AC579_2703 [Pseudocercospora musae]